MHNFIEKGFGFWYILLYYTVLLWISEWARQKEDVSLLVIEQDYI